MSKLVKIKYVGRKPHAIDNVARSGKEWAGAGDVQAVTPEQAEVLLRYPDQWAVDGESELSKVAPPPAPANSHGAGDVNALGDGPDLEHMTKPQLVKLAADTWGVKLQNSLSKKAMIDQIEELQRGPVE